MPNTGKLIKAAEKATEAIKKSKAAGTAERVFKSLSEIYNQWAPDLLAGRHAPSPEEKKLLDKQAMEFIEQQLVPRKLVSEQEFRSLARGPKKAGGDPNTGLIKILASMFSEHGGPITDEGLVENYVNARHLVSPEEVAEGLKFYPLSRMIAEQLGQYANKEFGQNYDIKQLAAIISSTSPGQGWLRNIADAHRVINAYHNKIAPYALNHFGDMGMKRAYLALAGEPVENLFDPNQAAKIGNFTWAIAGGGNPEEIAKIIPEWWGEPQIVADRHVFRVGTGERRVEGLGTSSLYGRFDNAVKKASEILGTENPLALQAILWTGNRTGGEGNIDPRFFGPLLNRIGPKGQKVVNLLERKSPPSTRTRRPSVSGPGKKK